MRERVNKDKLTVREHFEDKPSPEDCPEKTKKASSVDKLAGSQNCDDKLTINGCDTRPVGPPHNPGRAEHWSNLNQDDLEDMTQAGATTMMGVPAKLPKPLHCALP